MNASVWRKKRSLSHEDERLGRVFTLYKLQGGQVEYHEVIQAAVE